MFTKKRFGKTSEIVDATGGSTRFYPTHLFTELNCEVDEDQTTFYQY